MVFELLKCASYQLLNHLVAVRCKQEIVEAEAFDSDYAVANVVHPMAAAVYVLAIVELERVLVRVARVSLELVSVRLPKQRIIPYTL